VELPGGGADAAMEIYMLCDAVAADRRANPRDDIMTALVQAEVDGERLDDAELNLFFITLIVAGNETTRNLINHSAVVMMEHPEQAQMLRDDPSLWDSAVEEMLRWGSSIHNFRRTATKDTELRGVPIAEGDKVVLYYAAANRDEEVFPDPHTFDVGRTPNDHVTFGGGGVHFCLGASLARAEIKATMRQLVDRLPDLELAGPVNRLHSDFVNGVKTMPVRFTPTSPLSRKD
jgi:cholest-4-en-3-one 26-monooxygenase